MEIMLIIALSWLTVFAYQEVKRKKALTPTKFEIEEIVNKAAQIKLDVNMQFDQLIAKIDRKIEEKAPCKDSFHHSTVPGNLLFVDEKYFYTKKNITTYYDQENGKEVTFESTVFTIPTLEYDPDIYEFYHLLDNFSQQEAHKNYHRGGSVIDFPGRSVAI